MKLNKEWHLANKMPKNPTFEERLLWHEEHIKFCQCREMPNNIRHELERRKQEPKKK